jgi:hypothetical protein
MLLRRGCSRSRMFDGTHVVCQAPTSSPRLRIVAFSSLAYYLGEQLTSGGAPDHNRWTVRFKLDAVAMGKQLIPNVVYLGALSLLVFVFTLVLLIAAARLFIPSNVFIASGGISARSFTIGVVSFFIAVAVAVFLFARALQRRHTSERRF